MSPRLVLFIDYIRKHHRIPNFNHPKDLAELWMRYILDGKPMENYYLADKYEVREYVKKRCGGVF